MFLALPQSQLPPDFTFDCKGKNGTIPHPTDCTRYIQCDQSGTFVCACYHGMMFNSTKGICMEGECEQPTLIPGRFKKKHQINL